MARSKNAIGLDIGSSSIKVVQLKQSKKGYTLVNGEVFMEGLEHAGALAGTVLRSQ